MFNRNLLLILLTNVVLGSSMPMLIILGGLAGASLAPVPILITLPVSIQLLAGILFATPLSLFMGRWGRQRGFLLVAAVMSVGGLMASMALQTSAFWLLCVAHLVMGAALVGVNFLRFAAAEVVPETSRPNAISFTLASGIVAAFLGPSLFEHSRGLVQEVPFAGAYAAIAALGLLGAIPVLSMSLPHSLPHTRSSGAFCRVDPVIAGGSGCHGRNNDDALPPLPDTAWSWLEFRFCGWHAPVAARHAGA